MDLSKFYVITMISNPVRYKSRYNLYDKFKKHVELSALPKSNFWTCEVAYGERHHMITHHETRHHVQLQTWNELWHKENALNQLIQKLPHDWEYVCWVDADVEFVRKDWVEETWNQLQHYMFVQMWENAVDLGPNHQHIGMHYSFASQYVRGKPYCYSGKGTYYQRWHPGYAWGCRREAYEAVGGLIDTAILGSGDAHMSHGLIGKMNETIHHDMNSAYGKHLMIWQERAERYIRRDIGFVPGLLLHDWHGRKVDRQYGNRWKILVGNGYNPETDIKRDAYGLWQLSDHGDLRSIKLRDDIRAYFRARQEDSIDLT